MSRLADSRIPRGRSASDALPVSARVELCRFFFFNDTATTEIYTLSLHDALPICSRGAYVEVTVGDSRRERRAHPGDFDAVAEQQADDVSGRLRVVAGHNHDALQSVGGHRSEEHTSELQSHLNLVCRLLLAKKKAHADGWFIVFDTLTLADDRLEAFYDNPNALRDYFRDIGRMVRAAEGLKSSDPHAARYEN